MPRKTNSDGASGPYSDEEQRRLFDAVRRFQYPRLDTILAYPSVLDIREEVDVTEAWPPAKYFEYGPFPDDREDYIRPRLIIKKAWQEFSDLLKNDPYRSLPGLTQLEANMQRRIREIDELLRKDHPAAEAHFLRGVRLTQYCLHYRLQALRRVLIHFEVHGEAPVFDERHFMNIETRVSPDWFGFNTHVQFRYFAAAWSIYEEYDKEAAIPEFKGKRRRWTKEATCLAIHRRAKPHQNTQKQHRSTVQRSMECNGWDGNSQDEIRDKIYSIIEEKKIPRECLEGSL